ncbi:hypothetical protein C7Y70_13120 [Pseudoalteromonas sp. KS88]|uniref:helix-turn-helix transcriptional regulator n=1 Tax=unclassified Pseudoalteromonas TaxID=194690 RepID=UPI001081F731|nr:helix-turn-helix transcriptional regulator [Pseudoalteromonas sp. KS88]TGE81342.1 hypothetical protein C7Y70_13120 [Pseudoalteromonas sp. KS88]
MNVNSKLVGALGSPQGAAYFVKEKMVKKGLSGNEAAKLVGVNQSTMSRFLKGGALTEEMAVKLNKAFQMDIQTLFNLEAQKHTYNARRLVETC